MFKRKVWLRQLYGRNISEYLCTALQLEFWLLSCQTLIKCIFIKYSYQCQIRHRVLPAGITTTATASTHRRTRKIRQQLAMNVRIKTQIWQASATKQKCTSSPAFRELSNMLLMAVQLVQRKQSMSDGDFFARKHETNYTEFVDYSYTCYNVIM